VPLVAPVRFQIAEKRRGCLKLCLLGQGRSGQRTDPELRPLLRRVGTLGSPDNRALLGNRLAREGTHEIDDGAPNPRIGDASESLVQLQALAAAEELDRIALCRPLGEAGTRGATDGQLFVEELHRHAENLRKVEQAAGTDAIDALLVLLDLLEGEAEMFAEFFLAHPKQHAAQPHPGTDVNVDRICAARAALLDLSFFWAVIFRHSYDLNPAADFARSDCGFFPTHADFLEVTTIGVLLYDG
jgi:hypothetical protein